MIELHLNNFIIELSKQPCSLYSKYTKYIRTMKIESLSRDVLYEINMDDNISQILWGIMILIHMEINEDFDDEDIMLGELEIEDILSKCYSSYCPSDEFEMVESTLFNFSLFNIWIPMFGFGRGCFKLEIQFPNDKCTMIITHFGKDLTLMNGDDFITQRLSQIEILLTNDELYTLAISLENV